MLSALICVHLRFNFLSLFLPWRSWRLGVHFSLWLRPGKMSAVYIAEAQQLVLPMLRVIDADARGRHDPRRVRRIVQQKNFITHEIDAIILAGDLHFPSELSRAGEIGVEVHRLGG